jgi:hypothetical protein
MGLIQIKFTNIYEDLLRVIFWVVPRRVVFNSRRFGTLCLFHLHRPVDTRRETAQKITRNI